MDEASNSTDEAQPHEHDDIYEHGSGGANSSVDYPSRNVKSRSHNPHHHYEHDPKDYWAYGSTHHGKETTMDGIASDKVNIHVGGGEGGGSMAALVAALGQRNQGNDHAALIAALGNRNDSSSNLAPLFALMGRDRDDGHNSLWPIILLALLGRGGRGGLFGGGDGDGNGDGCLGTAVLSKLGNIEGAIPLAASQVANEICQSTSTVTNLLNQSTLAELAAIANAKDVTQNGFALTGRDLAALNQNVSEQGCQTRETVIAAESRILSRLDRNEIDSLRHDRDRAERALDVNSLRSQVEVNQTVTTVQSQAQAQAQVEARFNQIFGLLGGIANQVQRVRADSDIVNFGTMAASGNQATTSTQVR